MARLGAGDQDPAAVNYRGVAIGIHFLGGNKRSAWGAEGSYEPIAEKAFGSPKMDRYLFEYDTERAGGFEPLRFVPKGQTVVLGPITIKEPKLKAEDELLRRVGQASKFVPMENLALSTQCGFALSRIGQPPFLGRHAAEARTGFQDRGEGSGEKIKSVR